MQIYTVSYVPHKDYELLGLVKGSMMVNSPWRSGINYNKQQQIDQWMIGNNLDTIEKRDCTETLHESREIATQLMIAEAHKLGADAIIDVRYSTSYMQENRYSEVLVYGSAIRILES